MNPLRPRRWFSPAAASWTSWSTSRAWCPPTTAPEKQTTWTTPPQSSSSGSSGTLTSWMWSSRTERWVAKHARLQRRREKRKQEARKGEHFDPEEEKCCRRSMCNGPSFFCPFCLCYEGAAGKFSHATFLLVVLCFFQACACKIANWKATMIRCEVWACSRNFRAVLAVFQPQCPATSCKSCYWNPPWKLLWIPSQCGTPCAQCARSRVLQATSRAVCSNFRSAVCRRARPWTTSTGACVGAPWTAWTAATCCRWRRVRSLVACPASARSPTKTRMSLRRKTPSLPARFSPTRSL